MCLTRACNFSCSPPSVSFTGADASSGISEGDMIITPPGLMLITRADSASCRVPHKAPRISSRTAVRRSPKDFMAGNKPSLYEVAALPQHVLAGLLHELTDLVLPGAPAGDPEAHPWPERTGF